MFSNRLTYALLLLAISSLMVLPQAKACAWGKLVWQDTFVGNALNVTYWDPFITSNNANGWPWGYKDGQPLPSSAMQADKVLDYDLPTNVHVADGLDLSASLGSSAPGYSWTAATICTMPDTEFSNTIGYVFADKYVEFKVKMPNAANGAWPALWFLAAPGSNGAEIDLHEGGYRDGATSPDSVIACNVHTEGNTQKIIDTGVSLSEDFHTYGMAYKQCEYVKMYFDGQQIASFTSNVPAGLYFIIIGLNMAGPSTSFWHSKVSTGANGTPAALKMSVKSVSVYDLE